ncbi:MAG TPA: hypothetical protein VFM90_10600 [Cyclobacteriaceae bacterium]|nr:hypothetical protein [Cyclobacteriaceae bacterium]
MKKIMFTLALLLQSLWIIACPVCERNQPKVLKGITHGAGPESQWDYVIVWVTAAIVLATLFFSIKWLIKPGERSEQHIKRFILNNE